MRASMPERTESERDTEFLSMLDAYRPTGGLVRGDDLADLQISRHSGDHASLARAIVAGEILCFDWNRTIWVPAFQLDRGDFTARREIGNVLAELSGTFDGMSAALWFVAPNAWLRGRAPVELFGVDIDEVLDAARAERFIANG
jgi:hypothetical protein